MSPEISVVIVVHDMPQQALNTLRSFAVDYQRHVSQDDYEVIVVENESPNLLGEQAALSTGGNVRYMLRPNDGHSPCRPSSRGSRRPADSTLASSSTARAW